MTDVDAQLREFAKTSIPKLQTLAYLLCGDWQRAEDLVQVTLAKLIHAARLGEVDNLHFKSRAILLEEIRRE